MTGPADDFGGDPEDYVLTKRKRPGSMCDGCPRLVSTYVPPVEVQRGNRHAAHAAADIVYVMTQPDVDRDRHGAPTCVPGVPGDTRSVFHRALRAVCSENNERYKLSVVAMYAAACTPVVPREKPRNSVLHQCRPHVMAELRALEPQLVVAYGAEALRQLGITRKHKDVLGRVLSHHETGLPEGTGLLVTFSDAAVAAAPGLYRTYEQHLRNGMLWLESGEDVAVSHTAELDERLAKITANHKFVSSVDDVIALCDEIVEYVETMPDGRVGPGTIAVDTETTSLYADKDGARLIAFCFSWGEGLSTAFLFDHPFASEEYQVRLPELRVAVSKVLGCSKPKTFHNFKFDYKWIELAYGMPIVNVAWCSMCGEHLLDEDKKGHYGLKSLTTTWIPELSGYEDQLEQHVPQKADENEVSWARAMAEHPLAQEREGLSDALRTHADLLEQYAERQRRFVEARASYNEEMVAWRSRKRAYLAAKAEVLAKHEAAPRPRKPVAPNLLSTDDERAAYLVALKGYDTAKAAYEAARETPVPKFDEKAPTAPSRESMGAARRPVAPDLPADLEGAVKASQDAGYEFIPPDVLCQYGAIDTDVTRRLTRLQIQTLVKESGEYRRKNPAMFAKGPYSLMGSHVIPASRALGRMEYTGIRIDLTYADKLQQALTEIIEAARRDAVACAAGYLGPKGEPFNPASGAHLADVLYLRGWTHPDGTYVPPVPCVEFTELTGKMSTTAKALKPYLKYDELPDPDKPGKTKQVAQHDSFFIDRVSLLKKATKARDTFLMNVRALSARDGRIHTSFNIPGTGTGRLSCFTGEMRVLTQRGDVSIRDVRVGDYVWTHRDRWRRVLASVDKGIRTVETFTLSNGSILSATSDHRMYTASGEWVPLGVLADEYLEELDGRRGESLARRVAVHGRGASADRGADRCGAGYDLPHGERRTSAGRRTGVEESAGSSSVLHIEDRQQESDDRKIGGAASPVEGRVRERSWVSDHHPRGEAADGASSGDGPGVGSPAFAGEMVRAPHRRGSDEQRDRQPGAGDECRAQKHPRHATAALGAAVTSRYARRNDRVYDLTVEDDESFVVEGVYAHNSAAMNLQNIPSKLAGWSLKKLFVPDNDDFVLVNWDWKGAEVRVFTVYAADEGLIKALNDGMDMHSFFASRVYKNKYEDYQNRDTPEAFPAEMYFDAYVDGQLTSLDGKAYRTLLDKQRQQIKRVVFGILYGAGPLTIAEQCGCTIEEAKDVMALLFTMFPSIKEYLDQTKRDVDRYLAVETVFGRRRRFPLAASSRHAARAYRQAGNFRIQSTSSDIVMAQLVEIMEVILSDSTWPEWGIHEPLHKLGVKVFLTVHDSIVFQWPKKLLHSLAPWITYYGETRVREKFPWLPVPFSGDIKVGDSYGEQMDIDKYIAKMPPDYFAIERDEEDFEAEVVLRKDAFEEAS